MASAMIAGVAVAGSPASAQAERLTVSIADSGDAIANGQALVDAVAAATANGAPTTIELAAGRFDTQGNPIVLPGGIDLAGAGTETVICLCAPGDYVITVAADNGPTTIRDVHFDGRDAGWTNADYDPVWVVSDEAIISATDAELNLIGLSNEYRIFSPFQLLEIEGGAVRLADSTIEVRQGSDGGAASGVIAVGADISVENSTLTLSSRALAVTDGTLVVKNSTVRTGTREALSASSSHVEVSDSAVTGTFGAIVSTESTLRLARGSVTGQGESAVIRSDGGSIIIEDVDITTTFANLYRSTYSSGTPLLLQQTGGYMDGGSIEIFDDPEYIDGVVAQTDGAFLFKNVAFDGPTGLELIAPVGFTCIGTSVDGVAGAPIGCAAGTAERHPFKFHELPSMVEAEDYDIALASPNTFADVNPTNVGTSTYRADAVDIYEMRNPAGGTIAGERAIGAIRGGEWTEYTVVAPTAASYDLALRLASGADDPGAVEVFVDGTSLGVTDVAAQDAAGWWAFADVAVGSVQLAPGSHVIRVAWIEPGGFTFDRLMVTTSAAIPPFACSVDGDTVSWSTRGRDLYQVYRNDDLIGESAEPTFIDPLADGEATYEVGYLGGPLTPCGRLDTPMTWADAEVIIGDVPDDGFGDAVAINRDGSVLASADLSDVKVLERRSDEWIQRGESIPLSGFVSGLEISGSGEVVALAAGDPSYEIGSVDVLAWDGQSWNQRGDSFPGFLAALSDDGLALAVGSSEIDFVADDPVRRAQVYDWSGSEWVRRGGPIVTPIPGDGAAIDLAGDGNTLAVGTSIFGWDGSAWVFQAELQAEPSRFGAVLNQDGTRAVFGGQAGTFVYERQSDGWVLRGEPIPGPTMAVDISDDGDAVAIGTTRVFDWVGGRWVARASALPASLRIALSGDGSAVVVGLPTFRSYVDDVSRIEVYRLADDGAPDPVPDPEPARFACQADAGVLSWTDDGQPKYWMYQSLDDGATYQWLGKTLGETSFVDPTRVAGARYQVHYQGIPRADCTILSEPTEPGPGRFACQVDGGVLSWMDAGQERYWIYRSVDDGEHYPWLGRTLGETSYRDPAPAVGARYQVHHPGIARVECTIVSEPGA